MNKTVLITGSSRGIGKEIALTLAKSNTPYNIILNYLKESEKANQVVNEIRSLNQNVESYQCDVSNHKNVGAMIQDIESKYKKIDIVINNAGIGTRKLFQDISYDEWKDIFATNVDGMYNTTHFVLPKMISDKSGYILNISSIWGIVGASMEVHYSATKGAIIAFTKALAKECGYSNIRVNCIAPGAIATDMINCATPEILETVVDETPLGRLGTPKDIANLVEFLISEKGNFITGQVISSNGGFVIS